MYLALREKPVRTIVVNQYSVPAAADLLNSSALIPKVVWTTWEGGAMDEITKTNIETWKVRMSGWKVILLTKENMGEYVDISEMPEVLRNATTREPYPGITHRSDWFRLYLL